MRVRTALLMLLATACGAQAGPAAQPAPSTAITAAATGVATSNVAPAAPAQILTAPPAATLTPALAPPTTGVAVLSEYAAENGDRVLGRPGAPIAMLDYSDFQ